MNRKHLSDWVKSEYSKNLTYKEIGERLGGLSPQAILSWRDEKVSKIKPQQISALAVYRGESIEETCLWLEVEPPLDAGLAGRVTELESIVIELRDTVEALQKKIADGALNPSPLAIALQDELIGRFIDLRTTEGQQGFIEVATKALGGDKIGAQKVMLQVLGFATISPDTDYPDIAEVMAALLGSSWNVIRVMRLADRQPRGVSDPQSK